MSLERYTISSICTATVVLFSAPPSVSFILPFYDFTHILIINKKNAICKFMIALSGITAYNVNIQQKL